MSLLSNKIPRQYNISLQNFMPGGSNGLKINFKGITFKSKISSEKRKADWGILKSNQWESNKNLKISSETDPKLKACTKGGSQGLLFSSRPVATIYLILLLILTPNVRNRHFLGET